MKTNEKIIFIYRFNLDNLRNFCIRHSLYTCGTNREYASMFRIAEGLRHNFDEGIFIALARNIVRHSDGQNMNNVMFLLWRECVDVFPEVEKGDEYYEDKDEM